MALPCPRACPCQGGHAGALFLRAPKDTALLGPVLLNSLAGLALAAALWCAWSKGSGHQLTGSVPLGSFSCSVEGSGEPRAQPSVQRASEELRLCPVPQSPAAFCLYLLSTWLL